MYNQTVAAEISAMYGTNFNPAIFADITIPDIKFYSPHTGIEHVNWDGLRIAFNVGACGADAYARADVIVDYIGIFEIKPI